MGWVVGLLGDFFHGIVLPLLLAGVELLAEALAKPHEDKAEDEEHRYKVLLGPPGGPAVSDKRGTDLGWIAAKLKEAAEKRAAGEALEETIVGIIQMQPRLPSRWEAGDAGITLCVAAMGADFGIVAALLRQQNLSNAYRSFLLLGLHFFALLAAAFLSSQYFVTHDGQALGEIEKTIKTKAITLNLIGLFALLTAFIATTGMS